MPTLKCMGALSPDARTSVKLCALKAGKSSNRCFTPALSGEVYKEELCERVQNCRRG